MRADDSVEVQRRERQRVAGARFTVAAACLAIRWPSIGAAKARAGVGQGLAWGAISGTSTMRASSKRSGVLGSLLAAVSVLGHAAPVSDIDTLSPTNVFLGGAQVNCCGGQANTVAAVVDAGVAGLLTRVDLQIGAARAGHQVTMHLLPTTAAGAPVADLGDAYASFVLAVPVWSSTGYYPLTTVDVHTAGLWLDVGDDYAIVLTQPAAGPGRIVGWANALAPSTRLTSYDRSGSATAWDGCVLGLGCGFDVALRTFVDPTASAAVAEPGSLALAGGALLAAALAGRRRRSDRNRT